MKRNTNLRNIDPAMSGKPVEKTSKLSGMAGKSEADSAQNQVGTEYQPSSRNFGGPFGGMHESK